ncbi:MAG: metallophosphoesterase [Gammaproteobacteria bacterium]|nr:metallophosphoesterase [Gammaproteobacteria bacterium]
MHILRLPENHNGRDIVVGDIHGHFDEFEELLQVTRFDTSRDRLLSVGDYIDRGPHSERALEYLEQPWFYSVKGNHEAMLSAAQNFEPGIYELWMRNGGEWAENVDEDVLDRLAEIYQQLPYVIEVPSRHGKVAIVHADIPEFAKWDDFVFDLEINNQDDKLLQTMLWSRSTYRRLRLTKLYPNCYPPPMVEGVHRIYLGHSIVAEPVEFGSFYFIDTGAYANGQLTAVDINSQEVYSIGVMNYAIGY